MSGPVYLGAALLEESVLDCGVDRVVGRTTLGASVAVVTSAFILIKINNNNNNNKPDDVQNSELEDAEDLNDENLARDSLWTILHRK